MIPMSINIRSNLKDKDPALLKMALDSTVNYAADKLQIEMKAKVPVDTGRLQNSITKGFIPNGRTVGPDTPYDIYVEFGTSKMAAQPYVRPAIKSTKPFISDYLVRKVRKAFGWQHI